MIENGTWSATGVKSGGTSDTAQPEKIEIWVLLERPMLCDSRQNDQIGSPR